MRALTIALSLAGALLLAGPAESQEPPPPPPPPAPRGEEGTAPRRPGSKKGKKGRGGRGRFDPAAMAERLGLSEEQSAKLKTAFDEMRSTFRKMRENGGFDMEKMRGVRSAFEKTLKDLLSPEQLEKFKEMRRSGRRGGEGRGRRGEGGPGGRRRPSPERILEEAKKALVLSPEEEAEIGPLLKKVAQSMSGLRGKVDAKRRGFLSELKDGLSGEELAAKLSAFRKERDAAEAELETARKALAAKLDDERKARMVAFGLLR